MYNVQHPVDKSMVQKIPPPPFIVGADFQPLNRWLIEIQSILSNSGGIDPDQVNGLAATIALSIQNAADIVALQAQTGSNTNDIAAANAQIATINASIATINGQLTTLGARGELLFGAGAPAAGLGKVNDWYGDTAGGVGARVFIKKAVGVWTAFPF